HLLSLALDTRTGMSTSAIVIPLASAYRPVAVALGVLTMYTVVLVGLSGAVRGRMASGVRSARRWRSVHALSYVGWTLSVAPGAFAGSDTLRGPMPLVYLGCVVTVGAAYAVRIHREHAAAQGPLAL